MNKINPLTTVFGAVSAGLGSAGIIIAELGLCVCVLAPVVSLLGIISIFMGFLANNSLFLIIFGVALFGAGIFLSKRKNTCEVHGKK